MNNLKSLVVSGKSMSNHLITGDVLIYQELNDGLSNAQIGDLIVLESDNKLLVHRFLGQGIVKGDTNKSQDRIQKVVGVVTARIFKERYINYNNKITKTFSRIIAMFSKENTVTLSKIDKLTFLIILILSKKLRVIENLFLASK